VNTGVIIMPSQSNHTDRHEKTSLSV
jgi:hypothetical protein